jgi:hypothetical protein
VNVTKPPPELMLEIPVTLILLVPCAEVQSSVESHGQLPGFVGEG